MSKMNFNSQLQVLARINRIPLNGEFEITSRCNLNCIMCYTRKSSDNIEVMSKELSKDQILSIAKDARDAGMMYILLTGGEIFIRDDFKEIYEEIGELGLIISLFTNGTLITEEIADWLAQRPPRHVSITLYGASSEMYKKITGVEGGFNAAVRGIDLLLSRGIHVEVKTTWLKGNVHDYYKLYEIVKERGLLLRIVNYVFPSIDAENSNPVGERLDPVKLAEKEVEIESFLTEEFDSKNEIDSISKEQILETKFKNNNLEYINDAFDCGAGKSLFHVSSEGYVSPCTVLYSIKYHYSEMDFISLMTEIYRECEKIKRFKFCDKCEYKEDCFPCPARRLIETGDVNGTPVYLCEHAKARNILKSKIRL